MIDSRGRVLATILLLASPIGTYAANPQETERACFTRAGLKAGEHWLEECIIDVITLRPVHPVFESLAPGGGTGFGIGLDAAPNHGRIETSESLKFAYTTNGSYTAAGSFTLGFPGLSIGKRQNAPGKIDPYVHRLRLVSGNPEIDAKASLTFRAQRLELTQQDFYGLGQFTTQSGWSRYSLRSDRVGATLGDPLTGWFAPSIAVDYIKPDIGAVSGQARPSITSLYSEASAPGLMGRPGFARIEPQAWLRFKVSKTGITTKVLSAVPDVTQVKAGYAFYHDLDTGDYSFRQFHGFFQTGADLLLYTGKTDANRSTFSKALCPSAPAKECSFGQLYLTADTVLSQTSGASVTPFYFQPTLGGVDFQGEDTLRGFRDYRFRAPDRMFYQAEFRHALPKLPIGLLAFYDVGKVGANASDLGFSHLRHDLGLGAYVTAGGIVVLRFFVGSGTHEGVLPNAKLASGLL